jgi:uncharacterized protein (DUF2147 family)
MRRFGALAVLMMLLSSSAYAGTYSFTYHGHRIRVERPRHCFSTSCLSVSVPGRRGTQRDDGVDEAAAASDAPTAKSPAAAPALSLAPPSSISPATSPAPAAAPVQAKPAPSLPAAVTAPANTLPAIPPRAESKVLPVEKRPPVEKLTVERLVEKPAEKPFEKPVVTAQAAVSPTANASQQVSGEQADTPLGDWQTEGNKGLVRIEPCGSALCGYTVDTATNAKGETVLINMKPKGASDWTGSIVSRGSGNTYHAKMSMKQSTTLRVESCAVGRFFCSGNDWSRIVTTPQALITSRGIAAQPRS